MCVVCVKSSHYKLHSKIIINKTIKDLLYCGHVSEEQIPN